ncbi:hypothetical protein R2G56_21095 [Nitratireductor aquimarinus]|uniref:Amino acid transporter n=1 Tax=Nitratireductor aquimarinus TaxID=889300 RepID=A0ABU4ARB4_9HYPH|nr:hypothetical protein [Nitratireductor aquimarinus]MDV6228792.1 hypothetical protein [Nitratireductor aquimarinus]
MTEEQERQKRVKNERVKQLAGIFDRLGTTIAAIALIGPSAGLIYDTGDFRSQMNGGWGITAGAWLIAIVAFHALANAILGEME